MPFDPKFIPDAVVPLPTLGSRIQPFAFNNGLPIDHSRFSLVFNLQRGFAIYTAHNIDGATMLDEGEIARVNEFRADPAVPSTVQVDNDRGYLNNPWDRGHLVRRRALHWGDRSEAEEADSESFFWTNIAPQHKTLHHSAWGRIEDWMLELADEGDRSAAVFTGPVLGEDDPLITNQPGQGPIQIPAGFWKVMAVKVADRLQAAGFLVWQRDFDQPEPVEFTPFLEQVRVTTLEFLTGLSFGNLRNADPLRFDAETAAAEGAFTELSAAPPPVRRSSIASAADIFMPSSG